MNTSTLRLVCQVIMYHTFTMYRKGRMRVPQPQEIDYGDLTPLYIYILIFLCQVDLPIILCI